jgi:hypothetical protein
VVERAKREGDLPFEAYSDMEAFVRALVKPRRVILLVPAGKPVDSALEMLGRLLSKGDTVIDMGNEWYQLTETRQVRMAELGIHYMGYAPARATSSRQQGGGGRAHAARATSPRPAPRSPAQPLSRGARYPPAPCPALSRAAAASRAARAARAPARA